MVAVLLLIPLIGIAVTSAVSFKSENYRDHVYLIETVAVFLCAAAAFVMQLQGKIQTLELANVCGTTLLFKMDGFRSLYTLIASFMWLMTGLLSKEYFTHYKNRTRYYVFNQLTLFGTLGIFMSDDLYTTFIFFEIMSLSSYPWVAHDENKAAMKAASTYLVIAVFGGMVTLMGMFLAYARIGSLSFVALAAAAGKQEMFLPSALILIGFGAKAGLFPLYMWLPQAHPVAPAPASALLSGVLTKTGVFGMLVVCLRVMIGVKVFGDVMLALGLITMLLGALLALFSTNLKRILACSSMSQIGYITVGVAMAMLIGNEGSVPASGAVMHMVNHSLLKLTLFMAAGVIYMNLHQLELNDIRGFGIGKPLLKAAFLFGSLGLAGVPLFNGYLGKTLIHEGILEYAEEVGHFSVYNICEWIFLFAAGITTAYMLKIYVALFHQRNPKNQKKFDALNGKYMNFRSAFALTVSMATIPLLGFFPQILETVSRMCKGFTGIEGVNGIRFFSLENLKGGAVSLLIGTLVYILYVRRAMWNEKTGYRSYNITINWSELAVVKGFLKLTDAVCLCADNALENPFFMKAVPTAATAVMRTASDATDGSVLLMKRTLFKPRAEHQRKHRIYTIYCYIMGNVLNLGLLLVNKTKRRNDPLCLDFVYVLRERIYDNDPEIRRATRTVSFSLLLFTAGLLAALVYLIWA